MARRSLSSNLYRAARITRTASALSSGNPARVGRRAKNIALGRGLAKAGIWRSLWR